MNEDPEDRVDGNAVDTNDDDDANELDEFIQQIHQLLHEIDPNIS